MAARAAPEMSSRRKTDTSAESIQSCATCCRFDVISRNPPSARNAIAMVPIDITAPRPPRTRLASAS